MNRIRNFTRGRSLLLGTSLTLLSAGALHAADATSDDELEEVVVTGIRASLAQAVEVKKESIQIVDAVVAEDIGKFPDNNTVEALQRVSGVQVTNRGSGEVSGVSIRGLTDVTTTINGVDVFTASGRAVALQDIPASLLKQLNVYKTRSSDQIESGIAGVVDVQTHHPFDFTGPRFSISGQAIRQEQAGKTDPHVSALASNTWDTDFGRFGALANLSYARTQFRDQSVTDGAMVPFMTDAPPSGWVPYERIFPYNDPRTTENPIWQPGLPSGLPDAAGSTLLINGVPTPYILSRDAIFQSDFTGKRTRPAANVSFQFAPNDKSEYTLDAFYEGYRNKTFNSLLFSFVDWWGSLGPNPQNNIELYPGTNIVKSRSFVGNTYTFTSGDATQQSTDTFVYTLNGKWDLTDDLKLRSSGTYQKSTFKSHFFAMRLDQVDYGVHVDFNSHNGIPAWGYVDDPNTASVDESDVSNPALWHFAPAYENAQKNFGDAKTFTVDSDYDLGWGVFKKVSAGLRYDDRGATEQASRVDLPTGFCLTDCDFVAYSTANPGILSINSGFFDGRSNVPTSWVVPNGPYLFDHLAQFREQFGMDVPVVQTNFNVTEKTTALYLKTNLETEIADHKLDGEIGLRYVNAATDMTFYDPTTRVASKGSSSSSKVLPAALVRFFFTDDLLARASYAETIRRPSFTDLNPSISYVPDVTDIGYGTANGGNADLKPTTSKNFDLSLEWYFAKGSSLYGTYFKRKIDGFVIPFRRRITGVDTNGDPYPYVLSQPFNASNGDLHGFELGLVYFPDYLPAFLDGLGTQLTFTKLNSSQDVPVTNDAGEITGVEKDPIFGVSDHSYTAMLAYDKHKVGARLAYTWRSSFLNNNEAAQFANPLGIYRKAEASLDLGVNWDITKNLAVTFDATNLTNEIYQSYYEKADTNPFGTSIYSRTFALGVRASF